MSISGNLPTTVSRRPNYTETPWMSQRVRHNIPDRGAHAVSHPPPLNPFQSKAGWQINTNLYYLRSVSTARSQVWAGGQKKSGGRGWWLYSGGIIVPVVVISAAATVITIRFDFIWECLHSCSPLTPLTPFFPPFHPLLPLLLLPPSRSSPPRLKWVC